MFSFVKKMSIKIIFGKKSNRQKRSSLAKKFVIFCRLFLPSDKIPNFTHPILLQLIRVLFIKKFFFFLLVFMKVWQLHEFFWLEDNNMVLTKQFILQYDVLSFFLF